MEVESLIDALEEEGTRLVQAAGGDLSLPVPTCPGWTLHALLAHVGYVHRWAARQVSEARAAPTDDLDEAAILAGAPPADTIVSWVAAGHRALVAALRAAPADLACWTFLPAPSPRAFWARRQLHETTVHRVDAELAAGRAPAPPGGDVAADGVDEVLHGFHARRRPAEPDWAPATICFAPDDAARRWVVRLDAERLTAVADSEKADLVVSGTVAALYLAVWNRPSVVRFSGDVGVWHRYQQRCRVVWT